jgi:ABC-type antimicrobial peptide transport system permease subunit
MKAVTAQVYAVDRDQPVMDVRTVEDTMRRWVLAAPRFNVILLGAFAALGLALAVVGIYGVIAHGVAQRTREIGLRMALGAGFANVAWDVMRRGLSLVAIGLVLGSAASVGVGRLLRNRMRDFAAFDPAALAAVAAMLVLAGAAACFWPAQRAARVDPAVALRND